MTLQLGQVQPELFKIIELDRLRKVVWKKERIPLNNSQASFIFASPRLDDLVPSDPVLNDGLAEVFIDKHHSAPSKLDKLSASPLFSALTAVITAITVFFAVIELVSLSELSS
jgi:hypothetical protein